MWSGNAAISGSALPRLGIGLNLRLVITLAVVKAS